MALTKSSANSIKRVLKYYKALGVERVPIANPLESVRAEIGDCTRCALHKNKTHIVFGEGNSTARLMIIGGKPEKDDDRSGHPFMGEAGKLLESLLNRMGFKRSDVYFENIVKCRPPKGRRPDADEIAACTGFLRQQIEIVNPEIIITLGTTAAHTLLETMTPINKMRGKFGQLGHILVMPTYHPTHLLINTKDKMLVWADAQEVLHKLGMEIK